MAFHHFIDSRSSFKICKWAQCRKIGLRRTAPIGVWHYKSFPPSNQFHSVSYLPVYLYLCASSSWWCLKISGDGCDQGGELSVWRTWNSFQLLNGTYSFWGVSAFKWKNTLQNRIQRMISFPFHYFFMTVAWHKKNWAGNLISILSDQRF